MSEDVGRNHVEQVPVATINTDDERFQARFGYDADSLRNLAGDMDEFGQRSPVGLRSYDERDGYQIIYGFHRVKAAAKLGWDSIEAIIYDEIDDTTALELSVRDNEIDEELSQAEKARQAKALKEQGWSVDRLCDAFGAKKSAVYNWLKVADLEDKYLALIHEGHLSLYHGVELAKLESDSRRLEISLLTLGYDLSVRGLKEWVEFKRGNGGELSPTFRGGIVLDGLEEENNEGIQTFLDDAHGDTGLPERVYGRWDLQEGDDDD